MTSIRKLATGASLILWAAVLLPESTAHAQVLGPRPLENPQPEPPRGRAGMPMEGWVVLRYSVRADGATENVHVVDHMPPQLPVRDAVDAVEGWRFEPATADGTVIEWHNNETVVLFDVEETPPEPGPQFLRGYLEVEQLVTDEEYDEALKRNERLVGEEASRLSEIGIALVQNAVINMLLGDLHAARAAISRATDPRIPTLQDADLGVALQYRNALELQLGDVVGAIETFERRNELGPVPSDDPMRENAEALEAALGSDAAIAIRARIDGEAWWHTLARRTFAFSDVDGRIDTIHVECDRRRAELEYSAEAEWTLPESWGACRLAVEGRRGTGFLLYEFR